MMRQRARELGALPSGLVRPGEVFEWPTLEPWADPVSDQDAIADLDAKIAKAKADSEKPHESASGARVHPGKSEPARPQTGRRRGPSQAET